MPALLTLRRLVPLTLVAAVALTAAACDPAAPAPGPAPEPKPDLITVSVPRTVIDADVHFRVGTSPVTRNIMGGTSTSVEVREAGTRFVSATGYDYRLQGPPSADIPPVRVTLPLCIQSIAPLSVDDFTNPANSYMITQIHLARGTAGADGWCTGPVGV